MTEFSVGDKVRCDNNSYVDLTVGKTYVVTKGVDGGLITLVDDLGDACKYLPERFTKVDHGEFQIGDKVQRTWDNGTTLTGVIAEIDGGGTAFDENYTVLYNPNSTTSTTVLLERPVRLKKDVGTMYRIKGSGGLYVAVKLPDTLWLCSLPDSKRRWINDIDMQELLDTGEWVLWN